MATAAFRSTTKRTPTGGADDAKVFPGGRHRDRSLSRSSHRLSSESIDFEGNTPFPSTRRKFINTVRASGFPEVSLDDLAIELFSSGQRGRRSDVSSGRSMLRQSSSGIGGCAGGGLVGAGRRRRRPLSVVHHGQSDSESDQLEKYTCQGYVKTSSRRNKQEATLYKQVAPTQLRELRRCSSQKDFLNLHDSISSSSQSYSSALTDDEACDACYVSDGFENLQFVYAKKKSDPFIRSDVHSDQFEPMRKKHSNAVEEIKIGLEQVRVDQNLPGMVNGGDQNPKVSNALGALITARRIYSTELKQRSNDNQKISRQLNEEAERIMEDFISSVEDSTDISSFDGERSDISSTFGVPVRPRNSLIHFGEAETYITPPWTGSLPIEMDGVVFPWLMWETSNDDSPQFMDKKQMHVFPNTCLENACEGISTEQEQKQKQSLSPAESIPLELGEVSSRTTRVAETCKSQLLTSLPRRSRVDVDAYLAPQSNEEFLTQRLKLSSIISSCRILMCEGSSGPLLL